MKRLKLFCYFCCCKSMIEEGDMFLQLLLLSGIIILISVAGLGIRILIKKNGRFPQTHVGRNKEMAKRGIKCAQSIDVGCQPSDNNPGCSSCGSNKH